MPVAKDSAAVETFELRGRIRREPSGEAVLDDDTIEACAYLLVEGNTRFNMTRILGISRKSLTRWIERGRRHIDDGLDTVYSRLVWRIDLAEGEQERRLVQAAFKAALAPKNEGVVALKILERRNPEDWALAVAAPLPAQQIEAASSAALQEEVKRVLETAKAPVPDAEVVEG